MVPGRDLAQPIARDGHRARRGRSRATPAGPVRPAGIEEPGDRSPGSASARVQAWCRSPAACAAPGRLAATAREAVVAVHGLAGRRAEGNLRLATAARARGREHLARRARATGVAGATGVTGTATTVRADRPARVGATAVGPATAVGRRATPATRLTARTARRATARFAELTISVELLLARRERELLPAICARESLVLVQRKHSFSSGPRDRLARTERGVSCCRIRADVWSAWRTLPAS